MNAHAYPLAGNALATNVATPKFRQKSKPNQTSTQTSNHTSTNAASHSAVVVPVHTPIDSSLIAPSLAAPSLVAPSLLVPSAIVDPYARALSYLRLSVTDLCNFSCSYCLPNGYQGKKKPNELSVAEIAILVQAFARIGIKKVRITGGEPSLRTDLVDIIHLCKQTPTIEKVALTTNGYRLAQLAPQWINAGLDQLNISIDSFDPQQFAAITGVAGLADILSGIDALLDTGFAGLKINAVLMQDNAEQTLADALHFVRQRAVSVRFIELMQTGHNQQLFFRQHLSAQHIQQQLINSGWVLSTRGAHAGPAIEYQHAQYAGRIGVIAPYADNFCQSCNRLRVSSTGNMHMCLFDSVAFSLRPWLQAGDVDGLVEYISDTLQAKPAAHQLHQHNSGLMQNLSMLGG